MAFHDDDNFLSIIKNRSSAESIAVSLGIFIMAAEITGKEDSIFLINNTICSSQKGLTI